MVINAYESGEGTVEEVAEQFRVGTAFVKKMLRLHRAGESLEPKHGGGAQGVSLDEALIVSQERAAEIVALDDALEELARFDRRKSQIVELRFFGGLSVEETAEVLKISPITVMRDWSMAKAWLLRELSKTE